MTKEHENGWPAVVADEQQARQIAVRHSVPLAEETQLSAPAGETATLAVQEAQAASARLAWRIPATAIRQVTVAGSAVRTAVDTEFAGRTVRRMVKRRQLLRGGVFASLGGFGILSLGSFLNYFSPRKITGFGGVVHVPAAHVPEPGADPVNIFEARAWVVNLKPGEGVPAQFTGFAGPSDRGGILALYQKCPHLGCAVPWRHEFDFEGVQGWFRCPCHGSTYTKAGIRVFGPSPRPLDLFAVKLNPDGSLDINTKQITLGSPKNPQLTIQAA